ncbi:hypothetical protein RJT34_22217 [Clitoria ternatea]|uniref:Uncharacterized protein n=1 Tax=Clitoria ternatea TaxID=43366 RepID=A0AAN9IV17_CLITE
MAEEDNSKASLPKGKVHESQPVSLYYLHPGENLGAMMNYDDASLATKISKYYEAMGAVQNLYDLKLDLQFPTSCPFFDVDPTQPKDRIEEFKMIENA